MTEHRCVKINRRWGSHCRNRAKVERDGKWYCGVHDPERKAERRAEAMWDAKTNVLGIEQRLHEIRQEAAVRALGDPTLLAFRDLREQFDQARAELEEARRHLEELK